MAFLVSLLPATIFVVIGYFVLLSSTRADAAMKRFGQFLAIWMFFLGGAVVLISLIAPRIGLRGPMGGTEQHMERMEMLQEEQLSILRELQNN